MYGGKEYQDAAIVLGLYDFHARYYNPMYGRWFNQDPALQLTNPYLYCGNSPMMYTDPDGEIVWFIPIIIGIVVNVGIQAATGNINSWKDLGIAVGVGAVSGLAGFGVGSLVSGALGAGVGGFLGGAITGASGGAAGGFVGGASSTWLNGGDFGDGLKAGATGAAWGAAGGAVIGGATGGIQAVKNGGNFWTGKPVAPATPAAAPQPEPQAQTPSTQTNNNTTAPQDQNLPAKYYPENGGAAGDWERTTLKPGTLIERRGPETGTYASPAGTPDPMKSLPPAQMNQPLRTYEVLQPLPVEKSVVAPWFNQPGYGIQYKLPAPVEYLKPNYLKPTGNFKPPQIKPMK